MKACEFNTGKTIKQLCGMSNLGYCINCGIPVCEKHSIATSSGILCIQCTSNIKYSDEATTPIIEYPENEDIFWDQIS